MFKDKDGHIFNCIPSREVQKDWNFEHAVEANAVTSTYFPSSKDLREDWWTIASQGDTGSCVGWACADSLLRWHFVKKGWIQTNQLMSARFIWMASKECDEDNNRATTFIEGAGTSIKAALDIARIYGCVVNDVLPFGGGLVTISEQAFYAQAASKRIASYFNLTAGSKLNNFRSWIANNGPILTRLNIDSTWDKIGTDGQLQTYYPPGLLRGHAVTLVGYTQDAFIIRNSWGSLWGQNGFAFASNAYAEAAFSEAYGVSL
jgi:C1A family cysteine protease